jgi:hypothetical protein
MPFTIQHTDRILRTEHRFFLGSNVAPDGTRIDVDSISLLRNNKRWLPVMGEIHYSRVDPRDWRDELLKMRAGGIDIIASYVFWIHHEEHEGEWDWTGCRDLRQFVQTCAELKFPIIVRCGPWCHGEVRNGGLPDWILTKGFKTRTNDPKYLEYAKALYAQIEKQLHGLLFKDGGPVIGIQIENEYYGPSEHLLTLRDIAREVGIDVPLYTRTGWPMTTTPMPFGEMLPLFGAYPDGFWARSADEMPGMFWRAFRFDHIRTDDEVGADLLACVPRRDEPNISDYPYLTCEMGGGMEQSYHRRVLIDPMDILSIVMVKLGSGSNLPGYYMYHGGTNPKGRFTTLQESQATKYWNDLPVKSYDFQAPLGQFGQIQDSYYLLRRLHTFLRDFGEMLAPMTSALPGNLPQNKDDTQTLRFAIRSDGHRGFLFVNNYQRLTAMPSKETEIEIQLLDETVRFPQLNIPANSTFAWPFNLVIGGERLIYATAQLLARTQCHGVERWYYFQTPGVEAMFALAEGVRVVSPSRDGAFKLGSAEVILLSHEDSLRFVKTAAGEIALVDEQAISSRELSFTQIRQAGELRTIKSGHAKVAEAPDDQAFAAAAAWRIVIPGDVQLTNANLLRVHYVGDVARAYLNGELVADQFYHGRPFELSLRLLADAGTRELDLLILPWQKGAPIYVDRRVQATLDGERTRIIRVELISRH